ncbi:MAG: hypothetical protein JWM76_4565 [Pseudonocardiales bacterium]|nr:hypothetical protein [Pseudonocardiales bacterium]
MSDAFAARDAPGLLASFSAAPSATYVGSEVGESATGAVALEALFREIFHREASYAFVFDRVVFDRAGDWVWLVADGRGIERQPGTDDSYFPYRVTGVLAAEALGWRWTLLAGSEPTAPAT